MRARLEGFLGEAGIQWEPGARDGEMVLTLPGEKKLKTVCSLVVAELSVSVSAFVVRNPDENHEAVYRFLLRHNLKMPGLAYGIDRSGDIYVTGRVPLEGADPAYLDQVLGVVLEAADGAFNELLALGFLGSMKREWDWRVSRGEPTRNLEAFRHLLATDDDATDDDATDDDAAAAGSEAAGGEAAGGQAAGDEAAGGERTGGQGAGDEAAGGERTGGQGTGDEAAGDEAAGDEAGRGLDSRA